MRFKTAAVILCAAFLSAACGGNRSTQSTTAQTLKDTPPPIREDAPRSGTIKLVSSLPRTGSANAQTTGMVNGIRMAIAEVNAQAGPFKLVYEDWDDASAKKGDWDPELEAGNADKAIADPDVMAYIGTYNSDAAMISQPILNRHGLLMVSPANTYPALTKVGTGEAHEPAAYHPSGHRTYLRVVPADDLQGAVAARWVRDMGGRSVYVLHDNRLYGKGVASVFHQVAEDIGLSVLGFEAIDPKAQEYKSLMTKVRESRAEFIYFGGSTQSNAGQVLKDYVSVGGRGKFVLPDGCFEYSFIEAAGVENTHERAYVTFGGVPPEKLTGPGADFVKAYQERFNARPQVYAVYGYMAAKVAIDAILQAGIKDRWAISQAARRLQYENSALGSFAFTEEGDTTMATLSGNVVRNGDFEFVTLLSLD